MRPQSCATNGVSRLLCSRCQDIDHASTRNRVCHQPQLRSFSIASCIMILHGTHSFAVGFSRPSWQNLFQPQEKAAPLSESTAQCLTPLQTCGRHAAAHILCSPPHTCHAFLISQNCLPAPVLASKDVRSSLLQSSHMAPHDNLPQTKFRHMTRWDFAHKAAKEPGGWR